MNTKPNEPLIVIPGDVDQARGYRVTKWSTFDNYECLKCQYATLWVEKMLKHLASGLHVWSYPCDTGGKLSEYEKPAEPDKLDY